MVTCTLDSGKLILIATSSRMNKSGYLVLENRDSSTSNCQAWNPALPPGLILDEQFKGTYRMLTTLIISFGKSNL